MLTCEEALARKPFAKGNEIEMFGETLGWNDRDLGNFLRYYLNVIVETVRAVQPEAEENMIYTRKTVTDALVICLIFVELMLAHCISP